MISPSIPVHREIDQISTNLKSSATMLLCVECCKCCNASEDVFHGSLQFREIARRSCHYPQYLSDSTSPRGDPVGTTGQANPRAKKLIKRFSISSGLTARTVVILPSRSQSLMGTMSHGTAYHHKRSSPSPGEHLLPELICLDQNSWSQAGKSSNQVNIESNTESQTRSGY